MRGANTKLNVTASFEVTLNETVIYSKLETKHFPVYEEIVQYCVAVAEKGKCSDAITDQKSSCTIM
jgi:hypothetical protein